MLYIVRELPHTFEHLVNHLQDSRFTMCVRIHHTCSIGDEIHIVLKNTGTNVCVCMGRGALKKKIFRGIKFSFQQNQNLTDYSILWQLGSISGDIYMYPLNDICKNFNFFCIIIYHPKDELHKSYWSNNINTNAFEEINIQISAMQDIQEARIRYCVHHFATIFS